MKLLVKKSIARSIAQSVKGYILTNCGIALIFEDTQHPPQDEKSVRYTLSEILDKHYRVTYFGKAISEDRRQFKTIRFWSNF